MATKHKQSFDAMVFLTEVNGGRTKGQYRKNQVIFAQGDPADLIFYIQAGKVKSTVVSEQGKEAVVAILGTDDFFGEGCLVGQPRRLATAAAIAESVIMRLEKVAVTDMIHKEAAFSEMFITHTLKPERSH